MLQLRVDVLVVDVIGQDGGDGDDLSAASGRDGHEELQQQDECAARSKDVRQGTSRRQAVAGRSRVDVEGAKVGMHGERAAHQPVRGGHAERHREPHHATDEEAEHRRLGLRCHGALPIGLVDEHGAEVADDVGDAEEQTRGAAHGEEGRHAVLAAPTLTVLEVLGVAHIDAVDVRRAAAVDIAQGGANGGVTAPLILALLRELALLVCLHLVGGVACAIVLDECAQRGEAHARICCSNGGGVKGGVEDAVQAGLLQAIVDVCWGSIEVAAVSAACVHREGEDQEHEEDHCGVHIGREECRLQTTVHGVDPAGEQWNQEGGPDLRHACQVRDGGRAAEQEHRGDDAIGHEGEADHDAVRHCPEPGLHDLHEGVHVGCTALHLNGQHSEEQDLHGGARGIPERPRHAHAPAHVGRHQQCCCPRPLRDDHRSGEPGSHIPAGRVELLGGHGMSQHLLFDVRQAHGEGSEEETKANHDKPSPAFVENVFSLWGLTTVVDDA
mmetsp:Transcript_20102/g.45075  ORF Transcript_20102/g.45075 Transcript_20102/m.45075 type:complete len:498 (-) Transcript_20102:126-1619(-)